MIFMGFGAASVFTTTSIATQNAAEIRDLGVVTATVMFFRSLGGSFGMATFGTVLNSTIRTEIPKRIDSPRRRRPGLIRIPEEIARLPEAARAGRGRQRGARRQPDLLDLRRRDGVRRRRRRPAPGAAAAAARRLSDAMEETATATAAATT